MMLCNFWNIFDPLVVKIYHRIIFIFILHFCIFSCNAQLSFNYNTFSPNTKGIIYDGDAAPSDSVIQLTLNQNDKGMNKSAGRATYIDTMQLSNNGSVAEISTYFSFIIDSQGRTNHSDGLTFFIAPVGFAMPSVQEGAGLALVSGDNIVNSSLNQFVAVEFDTYKNYWDPSYDHVGININSMDSVKTKRWGSRILDGQINEVWISYNSSAKNLTVFFTSFSENKTSIECLWHEVDLSKYLPEKNIFGISAATGGHLWEIHTIHSWNFTSNIRDASPKTIQNPTLRKEKKNSKSLAVGLVVGGSACILVIGVTFLWFWLKRKGKAVYNEEKDVSMVQYEFENETGPKKYSYEILSAATKNFAESEKVGQGGFGGVYKGFLSHLNSYVAVKRISKGSTQGIKEYASEVKIISRLRHRNLVKLIGWCHEEKELLLVYEFMPNGSLDFHLFKDNMFLTWMIRYNIVREVASSLLYLHEGCEQFVLHRDIKTSNVMLDSNFNVKLGDFGLARLVDHGKEIETTVLAGTIGYLAPEYIMTHKASKETDVYSLGIVALEIASGRRPVNPNAKQGEAVLLLEFIWGLYGQGKILVAADHRLSADFDEKQLTCLMIVGLWCANPDHTLRPSIRQVIQVLNFEAPLPCLPSTLPRLNHLTVPASTCSDSRTGSASVVSNEECQIIL